MSEVNYLLYLKQNHKKYVIKAVHVAENLNHVVNTACLYPFNPTNDMSDETQNFK